MLYKKIILKCWKYKNIISKKEKIKPSSTTTYINKIMIWSNKSIVKDMENI